MVVGKYDGEKNYKSTNLPTGSAALNDAEFTVDYYDTVDYDNYDALKSANAKPARSWTFKTNTSGIAHFNASDFVAGSAFYYDSNGNPCIPRGTVVIRETKAPKGYNLSGDVSFQKIQESTLQGVTTFNTPEVPEQVYRSDIEFTKKAENGSDRLANVAFKVTSLTTGESHVVVTDENGSLLQCRLLERPHRQCQRQRLGRLRRRHHRQLQAGQHLWHLVRTGDRPRRLQGCLPLRHLLHRGAALHEQRGLCAGLHHLHGLPRRQGHRPGHPGRPAARDPHHRL